MRKRNYMNMDDIGKLILSLLPLVNIVISAFNHKKISTLKDSMHPDCSSGGCQAARDDAAQKKLSL